MTLILAYLYFYITLLDQILTFTLLYDLFIHDVIIFLTSTLKITSITLSKEKKNHLCFVFVLNASRTIKDSVTSTATSRVYYYILSVQNLFFIYNVTFKTSM